MNPYKWKYATKLQRIKWLLKQEMNKERKSLWTHLKIMMYKHSIEYIRYNQFINWDGK